MTERKSQHDAALQNIVQIRSIGSLMQLADPEADYIDSIAIGQLIESLAETPMKYLHENGGEE